MAKYPPEVLNLIAAFAKAAIAPAMTPVHCNRFMLTNTEVQDQGTVVFGGGALVRIGDEESSPVVNIAAAITFKKNVAEDLIIALERHFQVTDEDRKAAIERNTPE